MTKLRTADVPSQVFDDFSGGLNVQEFAHAIKDNELTVARNIRFDRKSAYKRGGWTKLVSAVVPTANNLIGVCQASWVAAGVLTRRAIATDGVTVYWNNAGTWTNLTGAMVLTAGSDMLVSFIQMNNLLIAYDGTNSPWTWDGAAAAIAALGGTPPIGNISVVWQNRLWWAGVKTARTRLYYSELGDPATYSGTGYIDVPSTFDAEEITGLGVLYGNLVIFKRNSIYILQGDAPENFVLSKTNSAVGCVSPYSVIGVGNLLYFASDKGLYAMNLSNNRQVSYKVEPRYTNAIRNQLISGNRNRLQALHYRRRSEIWMATDSSAAGQDHHDRTLTHNYNIVDENGDPACADMTKGGTETAPAVFADYIDTSGNVVPIASFYDKYVYLFSESSGMDAAPTGSATAIDSGLTGKYFAFGDMDAQKVIKDIFTNMSIAGGTPTMTITMSNDIGVSETAVSYTPTAGTFYNTKGVFPNSGGQLLGKFFKVGFQSNDGGLFSLFQYSFGLIWKGRRS